MEKFIQYLHSFDTFLEELFHGYTLTTMNEEPTPTVENPDILLPWEGEENCRHNVRVICDLEGLLFAEKNALSQTVHCESNYNPACVHENIVNGKVSSTDFGIAQINDFWHIGTGKDFPSSQYVLENPEACIRWMCKQWLAGNSNAWVCHLKSLYLNYTP